MTGVYYPAGGAICRLVNRNRREHGLRCVVESTGGSISNLESLRSGELNMGIVQSDWLYHAYKGSEVFSGMGPDQRLRVVFALHSEPFTIIVNQNSKINSFEDLKSKRVYLGNQGSGMRATMEELIKMEGWDKDAFTSVSDISMQDQAQAVEDYRLALAQGGTQTLPALYQTANVQFAYDHDMVGQMIDLLEEQIEKRLPA